MFTPLFYIVPAVLAIVCGGMLLAIRYPVPDWLKKMGFDIQLGDLRLEDVENLDRQKRALLSRVITGYMMSAAGITFITSTIIVLQGHGGSAAMAAIITLGEAAAALLMLRPLKKVSDRLKNRR